VVLVSVRDEDADDAKLLRIQRSCPVVWLSFELYIDVLSIKVVENSAELLAL